MGAWRPCSCCICAAIIECLNPCLARRAQKERCGLGENHCRAEIRNTHTCPFVERIAFWLVRVKAFHRFRASWRVCSATESLLFPGFPTATWLSQKMLCLDYDPDTLRYWRSSFLYYDAPNRPFWPCLYLCSFRAKRKTQSSDTPCSSTSVHSLKSCLHGIQIVAFQHHTLNTQRKVNRSCLLLAYEARQSGVWRLRRGASITGFARNPWANCRIESAASEWMSWRGRSLQQPSREFHSFL